MTRRTSTCSCGPRRQIKVTMLARRGYGVVFAALAGLGLALAMSAVQAATFTVTSTADPGDGTCDATCTLRDAIAAANANNNSPETVDQIEFAPDVVGTITLSDVAGSNQMVITEALSINGPGADVLAVDANADPIDADGESRIFSVTYFNADLTVKGLTLLNGNTTGNGGAIYSSANLTLDGVHILNAKAATYGGGVSVVDSSLTVTNSTISGCVAGTVGGGLLMDGSSAGDQFVLINSTVSGNAANEPTSARGGGVFVFQSPDVYISHATITDNTISGSSSGGGGIWLNDADATIENSIVANNLRNTTSGWVSDEIRQFTGSQSVDYSLVEGSSNPSATGPNNLTGVDPELGPLQDNGGPTLTAALASTSPAVGAGNNDYASGLLFDQRGEPFQRIVGERVDMGAFEFDPPQQGPNFVGTNNHDPGVGGCSVGACSLREAVTAANSNPDASSISFADGVTGTITLSDVSGFNFMEVVAPLTINGPGADLLTVDANADPADPQGESRLFSVTDAAADFTISGITLANGNTVGHGGAIYSIANLTLDGVNIRDARSATKGGAISVANANLSVTNSSVAGNVALAGNGGGLFVDGGNVSLINSTVSGNSASHSSAAVGGGVFVSGGDLSLIQSTLSSNQAEASAGGFFVSAGDASLQNSIVADNSAGNYAAFRVASGTLTADFSLVENASDPVVSATSNIIGQDPALGSLQNNGGPTWTQALLPYSIAIDAGDNVSCEATDQRGVARPFDGDQNGSANCDMGAFEVGAVDIAMRDIFADGFEQ